MAREVVRDIVDYERSGFEVVGIVGVGGSPSCGVCTTLDLWRSIEVIAGCPLAEIERYRLNEESIVACLIEGEGLFIEAIGRQLKRKHLRIRFFEHELLTEIRGQPIHLRARTGQECNDEPSNLLQD
jgi:hypothetical protein